jgi:hypothetical protein
MDNNGSENKHTIYFVAKDDTYIESLKYNLSPLGIEVTHYNDPSEIINNIDKSLPDMVLFSAIDFPRHWKPLLKCIRDEKSYKQTIFILIADSLPFEEAAKAAYLNINGIIPKNLLDKSSITKLHQLLGRYEKIEDKRKDIRIIPKPYDRIAFLFFHPRKKHLVFGNIINISVNGACFNLANPPEDLKSGMRIPSCSLRIGDEVLTVNSRVIRCDNNVGLLFETFESYGFDKLHKYLLDTPTRQLKYSKLK